jgi:hypothetical protein
MSSFAEISGCAARHLEHYIDPAGRRAFISYDRQGDPARFEPVDALAPALLDAPVRGSLVIELFAAADTPYTALRHAMEHLLNETGTTAPTFLDVDLTDEDGPWSLVRSVLRHSDKTPGLAAAMVTKMLHRKRPHLVPIFDSKVAKFYGTTARTPWNLWPVLQQDLRDNQSAIERLSAGVQTPDQRQLSPLRTIDIVVWEHVITGCRDL